MVSPRAVSVLSRAVAVLAAVVAVASCQAIAGIEDRTLAQESPLCEEYCTTVMETCVEKPDPDPDKDQRFSVYPSKEACLAVCGHLAAGNPKEAEPTGNTVACRLHAARLAKTSREYREYCPQAGPGGAGECGDDCESYCTLFEELCPNSVIGCIDKCKVFPNDGTFDAIRHHDGDTLQCRLVHVSNSALDTSHCGHAAFLSSQYCLVSEVTCERYCDVVMTTCPAASGSKPDLRVYDNRAQCLEVCGHLDLGDPSDSTQDTVGCRAYHAYNAFVTNQPESHCPHAGPGGDKHCGTGNCPAYCRLLQDACPGEFTSTFTDEATCLKECADLEGAGGDTKMVIANAEGDNVMCRLYQISRAFQDPTLCASAVGQDAPCR
jgi:hypothetical protein